MKLIILDRDGVINYEFPYPITRPQDWKAIPGSLEAIACLNRLGYVVVVATNQSGIGRGLFSDKDLMCVNQKLHDELHCVNGRIDRVFYCPHHPQDACLCRKPNPGLLLQIQQHYRCDLQGVPLIGNSEADIRAAQAVGCKPILVRTGCQASKFKYGRTVAVFPNLATAVAALLAET